MRRVNLGIGEVFGNGHLKRTGAFNAQALAAATAIVEAVRERGDAALREYTERFDGVVVDDFRVPPSRMAEAASRVSDEPFRGPAPGGRPDPATSTSVRSSRAGSPCGRTARSRAPR